MALHAFYSATAARQFGSSIYLSIDGTEVETTDVYLSKEAGDAGYGFTDKVYLGEVVQWVRNGLSDPRREWPKPSYQAATTSKWLIS